VVCDDGLLYGPDLTTGDYTITLGTVCVLVVFAYVVTVLVHELGHACVGWAIGGHSRPTGYGVGLWARSRSWRRTAEGWQEAGRLPYPHVRFDEIAAAGLWHYRAVIAGGIGANLLACLLLVAIGIAPFAWSDIGDGIDAALALRREGCGGSGVIGAALLRLFCVFLSSGSLLFAVINAVPFRMRHGVNSDGYNFLFPCQVLARHG
jgi:membrane-associated protease RseP (regulator of RpoE activity)